METELGSLPFYDFGQAMMHPMTGPMTNGTSCDAISKWLEADDNYPANFPSETIPEDIPLLDDQFFQFATSDLVSSVPVAQQTGSGGRDDDTFLLDLCDFDRDAIITDNRKYCPTLSDEAHIPVALSGPTEVRMENPDDFFNNNDMCPLTPDLVGPAESLESFTAQFFSSSPTPNSSSEINISGFVTDENKAYNGRGRSKERSGDEEDEGETDEDPKPGALNCKNLVSERNRRKRLSRQLLALRALVPNITKMDKRSVLVDALAYLKNIHEKTTRIQEELKEHSRSSCPLKQPSKGLHNPRTSAPAARLRSRAQILEIDTERMEERRFVVKVTCKGGTGVGGEALQAIESLGFEITFTSIELVKPQHVLITVFIRVSKHGRMTETKLRDRIISAALRSGLTLQNL